MPTPATTSSGERMIENRTYDEIAVGDRAVLVRRLTREDIELFAVVSGDLNPAHLDDDYAEASRFRHVIAHGMWTGALFSSLLGTRLPGPGTIYLGQNLSFTRPVAIGDTITVTVEVREKHDGRGDVVLACRAENQDGHDVALGEAVVRAPTEKVRRPLPETPAVYLRQKGVDRLVFDSAAFFLSLEPYRAAGT